LVVTNPNDDHSIHFHTFSSSGVILGALLIQMTAPIDLDRQSQFVAIEVSDKAADDVLSTKLETKHTPISEDLPRFVFSWREFTS